MGEGPVALLHRIVDALVDRYRPEVEKLEDRLDKLEKAVFVARRTASSGEILQEKREVSVLRRIITPQRDVIGAPGAARVRRREHRVAFRFRDVLRPLGADADDAAMFQDRITGMLEAHLSNVSNRLNEVMKVLTVVPTIFMPLTLLSGLWGMNVLLPNFPGTTPRSSGGFSAS